MTTKRMVNGEERLELVVELKEIVKDFLDKSLLLLFIHLFFFDYFLLYGEERPKLGSSNKYLAKKIGIF
jgi:hypothetical protein